MPANYLIVVGVDGSEGGSRALDWAAREAAARGGAVQAVLAWSGDGIEPVPLQRTQAAQILDREVKALAARRGSHVPVAAEAIEGRPADVLTAAAETADLLVLGCHGHGRVRHTVAGSVGEECIGKATCPVVVIPGPAGRREPVRDAAMRARSSYGPDRRGRRAPAVIRPGRAAW